MAGSRLEVNPRVPLLLAQMTKRAQGGVSKGTGAVVAKIMRTGPGSVDDQFTRQALDSAITGKQSWAPTKSFGNRPPPSSTLQRTGRLRRAWTGSDPASITNITANYVEIGVRGSLLPAASVQQTGAVVKAKKFTSSGRPVMQVFLGMEYGVWIPAKRLLDGLRIPPRPVGVSATVISRAGIAVMRFLAIGSAVSR